MPTSSKSSSKTKTSKSTSKWERMVVEQKKRYRDFMNRRPHRSFRRTRHRDYASPLELPGNFAFTAEVTRTLWKYKKTFLLLAVVYVVLFALLVGIQSQDTYSTLIDTLKETGGEVFTGNWGALGQAGLLFLSIASLGTDDAASEAQQIFSIFIFLLIWLATVWLLRNLLAGHKVRLRDGLYNSGAPLFAMAIIALVIAIQLIPVALALIGYSAATSSGLLADGGAVAMLFWIGVALLGILSLYWITSSLFAMIIVTLPGTYPYQALRASGDLVLGRRIKLLLRWIWMGLVVAVGWALILIPIILLDMGLKSLWPALNWLPIVPVVALLVAALSTVWVSSYVYLLYRKVVDYVSAA